MSLSPFAWPRMKYGLAGCGIASCLALAGCEGSATQTTTGKGLQGVLVDSHGDPVSGATVRAWPVVLGPMRGSAQDSAGAYSARTDERGHYAISDLEVGVYNLFGANPANRATVLIPRVKYLEQAADLGTDTLKAPGVIVGMVGAEGGDPPSAFCYLEGSNYAAISDPNGRFVLPDLAEGVYRLNYFAEGYARASDTAVTVRSGDTTFLAAKLLAPNLALQPPAPQGLSASYDSVFGTVSLAWKPVHVDDLMEYVLEYQDSSRSGPPNPPGYLASWTTPDTSYADGMMDYFRVNGTEGTEFTRRYWVRAKDLEGNLSPKPSEPVTVRITVPGVFKTVFTMAVAGDTAGPGYCRDTLAFALNVISSPDSQAHIEWRAKGYFLYSSDIPFHSETAPQTIQVSIGAPHRDTLYLTHEVLESLGKTGSQGAIDSVTVTAQNFIQGVLIHGVSIPVGMDSLGCFHAYPATEKSNSKPLF